MEPTQFEKEVIWPVILKAFQDANLALRRENWFWCPTCHCVSYDYGCECKGTSCNAHGCDKCKPLWDLVRAAENNHMAPNEEEAKANNVKRWGQVLTPEEVLLNKIFGDGEVPEEIKKR